MKIKKYLHEILIVGQDYFLGCFLGGNIVQTEVWCSRGGGGTWPVCHAVTATNSGYFAWVCHPNCRLPRLPLSSLPHGSLGLGVLWIIGHPHHGSLASKDFTFDLAPLTVATLKVLRVLADTVLTGSFNFIYVKLGVPLPPWSRAR